MTKVYAEAAEELRQINDIHEQLERARELANEQLGGWRPLGMLIVYRLVRDLMNDTA